MTDNKDVLNDKDLVELLRSDYAEDFADQAADRIEELLRDMVRAKECLRNRMHFYECDCGECDRIRITLEVIKGET